jgi:hypothetical protein
MPPPSTDRAEPDKSVISDEFHNEPDFIHMRCEHNFRAVFLPAFSAHDTAETILFYLNDSF